LKNNRRLVIKSAHDIEQRRLPAEGRPEEDYGISAVTAALALTHINERRLPLIARV
jgi:hypothetical protein